MELAGGGEAIVNHFIWHHWRIY